MKIFLISVFLFITVSLSFAQSDTSKINIDSCFINLSWSYPIGYWDSIPESVLLGDTAPFVDCKESDCTLFLTIRCATSDYSLQFFNRWGEILFESKNPNDKWNAYGQPDGFYIYWAKGTYSNGEKFEHKGHVTFLN